MDYSKFLDDNFDPKDWINVAFKLSKDTGTSSDSSSVFQQYATTLVMKLQMLIQEVNSVIEETSHEVVSNLPRVLRDIDAVKQEALLLQEQMKHVKQDIQKVEQDTSQSMQILLKLDTVKSRMEETSEALREADNWTVLSSEVEDVIQSEDINALAEKLVAMQQSLRILANVPDYDDRCQHLEALKNRLETLASPHVINALSKNLTDEVKKFVKIFEDIQRIPQMYRYYEHFHKSSLIKAWAEMMEKDGSISSALPKFYELVLSTWHEQMTWCSKVFSNPIEVICSMVSSTLASIDPSISTCIAQYLEGNTNVLPLLCELLKVTNRFTASMEIMVLEDCKDSVDNVCVAGMTKVIYEPYKDYFDNYSKLESHIMKLELENLPMDHHSVDETISLLSASVPQMFKLCQTVSDRCLAFTMGKGFPELVKVFKLHLSTYATEFKRVMVNISEKFKTAISTTEDDNWQMFQLSMRLIQICGNIIMEVEEFDQSLVANILTVADKLDKHSPSPLTDFKVIFAGNDDEIKLRDLLSTIEEKHTILALSIKELSSLSEEAHKLAFDVAFSQIDDHLKKLATWPVWTSKSAGGALTANLPTFSLSPQEYITKIGQYVMTLPQHLEPFTTGDNLAITVATKYGRLPYANTLDDGENIDHVWIESIAKATMHTYAEEILKIPEITAHATRQLTTDLDYMINVLDDLGLSPLDSFSAVANLLKARPSEFSKARKAAPPRIAGCIETMRNIRT